MSKTWRKLLSVLLALSMIVSLVVTGYAVGNDSTAAPQKAGTELELEEIDPSKLNVPRLGQIDENQDVESLPLYKDDDTVRVSIFLDKPSTLERGYDVKKLATSMGARFYRQTLKLQQDSMVAAIENATRHELDVKWNLTLIANAISANVRYGDIAAIKAMPGVKSVVLEEQYEAAPAMPAEPMTSLTTEYMVGATQVWGNNYTGAGARIAIIDSGIDATHQSFDAEAFEYSLAKTAENAEKTVEDYDLLDAEEIAAVASQLHVSIDPERVYLSSKIPFAYNYIDSK